MQVRGSKQLPGHKLRARRCPFMWAADSQAGVMHAGSYPLPEHLQGDDWSASIAEHVKSQGRVAPRTVCTSLSRRPTPLKSTSCFT